MDIVQILSNFDAKVIKEPRGFMKVLQFFFTICAFATTTSFSSILKISVKCNAKSTDKIVVPIYYSFQLEKFEEKVCTNKSITFLQDFSSDSRFFVAVGVLAFLFTIGILSFYLTFDSIYLKDARIPTLDFVCHVIFAVLFLAGSSAWANSLNGLKTATSLDTIIAENKDACKFECRVTQEPDFAKLNISIILGFLNLFLFASNLWFIYKETTFFASKAEHPMTTSDIDHKIPTPRM